MARLYRAGFSGRAVLRHAEAEKIVHFAEGQPVFATSNLPHDRMGSLLYREGKITRAQHARSREIVAESGRRMGEILVDMGFLKRRELLPAVRRHIEDVVYSLFSWDSGEYATVPGEPATGEKIKLSRHPAALIVEGIRRKYGLDILEARLGTADTLGVPAPPGMRWPQCFGRSNSARPSAACSRCSTETERWRRSPKSRAWSCWLCIRSRSGSWYWAWPTSSAGQTRLAPACGRAPVARRRWWARRTLPIDRQRLLAKHAHVTEADYFTLLGVRREASGFEVQRAYEAARRDFAVDTFPAEVRQELSNEIDEINSLLEEAYAVLRNDHLRDSYRSNLRDFE